MLSQFPAAPAEVQTLLGGFPADISTQRTQRRGGPQRTGPIISAQVDDAIRSHGRWTSPRFYFLAFRHFVLLRGPLPLCGLCVSRLRNRISVIRRGI